MSKALAHNPSPDRSALKNALAWLAIPPLGDHLADLVTLHEYLTGTGTAAIKPAQHFALLDLFQTRVEIAAQTLRPQLLEARLPLPRHLRAIAQALTAAHEALARGYLYILIQLEKIPPPGISQAVLCTRGLANLAQLHEISQLVWARLPADFWRLAQTLYAQIPDAATPTAETSDAAKHMKAMLALAAAQPEGLSPRELTLLAHYLRNHGAAVVIHPPGASGDANDYRLDLKQGMLTSTASRRLSPDHAGLCFSCRALSQQADTELGLAECTQKLPATESTFVGTNPDIRDVLLRAARRWASRPPRLAQRQYSSRRIELCTHLGALWEQLGAEHAENSVPASHWILLNESASGCAVMHVAGKFAGLMPGSAIGLRTAENQPWNIYLLRWARSENPEHIELGLELLAQSATPVRIVSRAAGAQAEPVPALLLPAMPGSHRGEALLTARNHFAPGPFTLIVESARRIQITECTGTVLATHTASIEIFEFTRQRAAA